jgi:periplasmic protein TonB
MLPNQIKDAHILDILFEGRNKEYGAYELRKTYNRRIVKALFAMGAVVGLLFLGSAVSGFGKGKKKPLAYDAGEVILNKVEEVKPVVPPPVRVVPPPQVATRIFSPPVIVKGDVKPDEKPPENDELNNVRIGDHNAAGVPDGDIVGPPVNGAGAGVVEAPKKQDVDEIFTRVEIDASYPGGNPAWARFLGKNLRFPDDALNNGVTGTVMVQFVVDLEGNVSDIQVISGPENGGLREEAIRVLKRSGKWVPAIQNGRPVKAYRRQPFVFVQRAED